ncbi:MAG: rod shape-determining protein MreC [Candidatus Omnitrophica bacterium]|nr:rod shape-determining protein MreC [Candidatus Omnitrophota bacterium]
MRVVGGLKPLLKGIQAMETGFTHLFGGIVRGPFLLEENQILRERLQALLAHEGTHQELFQENRRLRELLRFKAQSPWVSIPAEVIGHELRLWSRTLLLDQGSRDGVRLGMAVVTPVGLVGRISEVGPSSSRVILVTDPHFRVAGVVSSSRASGLVMGSSSGSCLITYIPRETPLKVGESVLTAGGKSFSPGGIPIGVIQSVEKGSFELFSSARLRPAVDLSTVEEVLVVAWPTQEG